MGTPLRKYFPLIISSGSSFTRDFPDGEFKSDFDLDFDNRIVGYEDAEAILKSFRHPLGAAKKRIVIETTHIVINYRIYKNNDNNGHSRREIKRALTSLDAACIRLKGLIKETDILRMTKILEVRMMREFEGEASKQNLSDLGQIESILDRLSECARYLDSNDEALRYFSISPPAGRNRKPERLIIWEPIFSLWMSVGLPLRLSSTGPLMRTLKAVHNACGLEAPSLHAVREAVRAETAEPA